MLRSCDNQNCSEKGTFFCTRCKLNYYCSRECQTADWKARHKEQCRRFDKGLCMNCKWGIGAKKCSRCEVARYCSQECQKKSWKDHKPDCERLAQMKLAGRDLAPLSFLLKLHVTALIVTVMTEVLLKGVKLSHYAAILMPILEDKILKHPDKYMSSHDVLYWKKDELVKWLKNPPSDLILDLAKINTETIPDDQIILLLEYKESYILYKFPKETFSIG